MSSEKDESVKDAPETELETDSDAETDVGSDAEINKDGGADVGSDAGINKDAETDVGSDADPTMDSDATFDAEPADDWIEDPMDSAVTESGSTKTKMAPALIIGLVIAVGAAAFFAGTFVTGMNSVSEEYIDEAIAKLELKLLQDRLPRAAPTEPSPPQIRPAGGSDPIIGSPDAPIEIIEYSDFQCPFCARFYEQTLPKLIDEYIAPGKAKLAFRDFPIQNIHPNAAAAALAAECANEQDKFKGMHDVLFERQREWGAQSTAAALGLFSQYAVEIEVEQTAFDACIASQRYLQIIGDDLNEGSSYGVTGTPGFFVGNEQIGYVEIKGAQPYEVFKQIIDAQLGA